MAQRFQRDDGLPADDAALMTQSLAFARYYEAVARGLRAAQAGSQLDDGRGVPAPQCRRRCDIDAMPLAARDAGGADPAHRRRHGVEQRRAAGLRCAVGGVAARVRTSSVDALIEAKGLRQMSDSGALEAIVDAVIAANAKSVDEFRAGKDKAFNALVGQVMKASKGKANPAQASELLKRKLG